MPTKLNSAGQQQEYNASTGEYSNGTSSSSTASNASDLRKKALKLGLTLDYIGRDDIAGGGSQRANYQHYLNEKQALKDNGFTDEEIETIRKDAREKQEKKNESFKNFQAMQKENYVKKALGDNVEVDETGKRYKFKHAIDNDNINLVTNNVQYWKNKDAYVLWVDKNKVVYLKAWNVTPISNAKYGNAYAVKLNRNYFKPYNTFETKDYMFDKEDTFDSLLEVAKQQDNENVAWKV